MLIKRLILIFSLPSFLAGCAEFYGSQPPAPVYGSGVTVYSKTTPSLSRPQAPQSTNSQPINQGSTEIVETQPLKEFTPKSEPIEELAPEPLSPEQEASASEQDSTTPEQESATPDLNQESEFSAPKQEILAPIQPPPFEPLETFAPLSPAVSALALAANQNSKSGDIEAATTTIERAIRIEPRNATLYYKLALLRLKQSKPRLAEDLAKKAALLASNDTQLKKHSWLLVARAREMQGDFKGGKEARAKVDKF